MNVNMVLGSRRDIFSCLRSLVECDGLTGSQVASLDVHFDQVGEHAKGTNVFKAVDGI